MLHFFLLFSATHRFAILSSGAHHFVLVVLGNKFGNVGGVWILLFVLVCHLILHRVWYCIHASVYDSFFHLAKILEIELRKERK